VRTYVRTYSQRPTAVTRGGPGSHRSVTSGTRSAHSSAPSPVTATTQHQSHHRHGELWSAVSFVVLSPRMCVPSQKMALNRKHVPLCFCVQLCMHCSPWTQIRHNTAHLGLDPPPRPPPPCAAPRVYRSPPPPVAPPQRPSASPLRQPVNPSPRRRPVCRRLQVPGDTYSPSCAPPSFTPCSLPPLLFRSLDHPCPTVGDTRF
jgi:hypothetical protein